MLKRQNTSTSDCYHTTSTSDDELRVLFNKIDTNMDQKLSKEEIKNAMGKWRLPASEVQLILDSMTKNEITFAEFREFKSMSTTLQQAFTQSLGQKEVLIDLGSGSVSLTHLCAEKFAGFRGILGISDNEYFDSLSVLSGGVTQASGKSGSLFWFTGDKQYMLKSISQKEMDTLLNFLPQYMDHFRAAKQEGRLCLLPWFMGAYKLKDTPLIAMNNVFVGEPCPERIYDLKGTTEDRFVEPKPGKVMKDLNYRNRFVCIDQNDAKRIQEALQHDTQFLRKHHTMDYSLLLGVCPGASVPNGPTTYSGTEFVDGTKTNVVFRLGLIDVLVEYKGLKKVAHYIKKPSIGLLDEIDTEPPPFYQERFMDFMKKKITYCEGDKPFRPVDLSHKKRPPLACLAVCCSPEHSHP